MLSGMISDDRVPYPSALSLEGEHPRPQLVRRDWRDLGGEWGFSFDDADAGRSERWYESVRFDGTIVVPYPPESPASGVGDTSPRRVLWYSRLISSADLDSAGHGPDRRLLVHFGAVDYRAEVWWDGSFVGGHEGGHTPFTIDVTDVMGADEEHRLVVRTEDDPDDVAQPRGKQDWREHPHVIWYHRTSGIWQPVWLESVPKVAIDRLHWTPLLDQASVRLSVGFSASVPAESTLRVDLLFEGKPIASTTTSVLGREADIGIPVIQQANGQAYEELLWSPEHPRLIDARVRLDTGAEVDVVESYLGLRSARVERGRFLLNERPYFVRSVLNQGYWPSTHLAAPSAAALREEAEWIKRLGFNAARLHQKFEDPRFLYWADRLGILIWGEAPAAFTYTSTAVERSVREWLDVVRRDFSHPSIVTWVPLNESWGVQHIAHDERMQHYARSLVGLTKALDPTRPVVSNDGWEQVDTDILGIHDYEGSGAVLADRYADRAAIDALVDGIGPAGRILVLSGDVSDAPVMLTEFGGVSFDLEGTEDAWGYSAAGSADEFRDRISSILGAVNASRVLAGFCYTQLADTLQETNGLLTADRTPKLPADEIRRIITGRS